MKHIKNWLFPLFTGLAVLACALLPKYLSQLQDKKIFHVIHTENMSADSSLPVWSPDLMQKIHLMSTWRVKSKDLIIILREINESESTPEELQTMRELVLSEIDYFIQENLLPEQLFPDNNLIINGWRIYLQDNRESTGNWYLQAEIYDESGDGGLWLMLDEETDRTLSINFYFYATNISPLLSSSAEDLGMIFLDHLNVEYDPPQIENTDAIFHLKNSEIRYSVLMDETSLFIEPVLNDYPNLYDSSNASAN